MIDGVDLHPCITLSLGAQATYIHLCIGNCAGQIVEAADYTGCITYNMNSGFANCTLKGVYDRILTLQDSAAHYASRMKEHHLRCYTLLTYR